MTTDTNSIISILGFLASGGAAGIVIQFLAQRSAWFQNLAARAKFFLVFGISVLVPVIAQLIIDFVPASTLATLQHYWPGVVTGLLFFIGSQVTHQAKNPVEPK